MSDMSKKLKNKLWPDIVSEDAYLEHFDAAVGLARECGLNPNEETPTAQQLRATWWDVIAEPPYSSPYNDVCKSARASTQHQNTTITAPGHQDSTRTAPEQ